ncbi:UNVERIFIED_CONTAM: hypothetical protein HDU68_010204 [Siphonaria sp. JEL0065]|nr:hypothetical protein HDU68_010204 [Siphonaria sp. JEL0065]
MSPATHKLAVFILDALQILWTHGVDPFTSPSTSIKLSKQSPSMLLSPPLSPIDNMDEQQHYIYNHQHNQIQLSSQQQLIQHVVRLLSPQTMNNETVCLALILISRLRGMNRLDAVRAGAEAHLLSTAFLISLKALDDWRIDSSAWVSYCKQELPVINAMEKEFLCKIDWQVNVTRDEYNGFLGFLRGVGEEGVLEPSVFSGGGVTQQAPSKVYNKAAQHSTTQQQQQQLQYTQKRRASSGNLVGVAPGSVLSSRSVAVAEEHGYRMYNAHHYQHQQQQPIHQQQKFPQEYRQESVTSYQRHLIATAEPSSNDHTYCRYPQHHPSTTLSTESSSYASQHVSSASTSTSTFAVPTKSKRSIHGRHVSNPQLSSTTSSWRLVG